MKKQAIVTKDAPAAIGPYSQGVSTGGMVFVSGQLPINPITTEITGGDVASQTEQSLLNIAAVLEAAGMRLAEVVKTTVFLKDMNDFAEMNAVYAAHFSEPYPARAAVQAARLPKDVLVEIEAIAVKE